MFSREQKLITFSIMLFSTFSHIPSIGAIAEEGLWNSGVYNWDLFVEPYDFNLPNKKIELIKKCLLESREHMKINDPNYFESLLKPSLHWRFFPEFRRSSVYLDIETNGGDSSYGTITTIALYDGCSIFYYVKDKNLNDFVDDIQKYNLLITYSGKCFDVPFIENYFNIKLTHAHIDLRYILASLGYKGGLKACEIALGIDRGDLAGVDGYCAVLLWNDYCRSGNPKALETLLAYNIEDVINLEKLMIRAYNMNLQKTPFYKTHQVFGPKASPEIPFKPDLMIINRLKDSGCFF